MASSLWATCLDTGHLQSVNRIRYTLLKLVFDSGGTEQKHILLNELRGLVQSFAAAVDSRSSLVIDGNPLAVFRFWNVARGNAKRP